MPDVSGVTVVTCLRAFYFARKAAGATGARHSLRPLISEGQGSCTTRALTAPRGGEGVFEIAHRGRPCLVRNCAQEQGPPRERSSSRRRVGCIERRLSEAFAQQRRSVVMGPCFRRDDIAGCLKFKLVREAAELGADRNHQHHAAGVAQIFRVMAEGRRQRADVARPLCPDRNLVGRLPEQESGGAEQKRDQKADSSHVKGSPSSTTRDESIRRRWCELCARVSQKQFPGNYVVAWIGRATTEISKARSGKV